MNECTLLYFYFTWFKTDYHKDPFVTRLSLLSIAEQPDFQDLFETTEIDLSSKINEDLELYLLVQDNLE